MGACCNTVNESEEEGTAIFVAMPETRQLAQPNKLIPQIYDYEECRNKS